MDDELKELEAELRGLELAAPSRRLMARIERDLAAAEEPGGAMRLRWLWTVALPAAAVVALMVTFGGRAVKSPRQGEAVAEMNLMKPVAAENVLIAAEDEGLVTLSDGTPARRARLQYVDTITWKNPRTNASLTWTVPREEVRVVPIAFQ